MNIFKNFLSQVVRIPFRKVIEREIFLQTGMRPITDCEPEDVFIVGYPKSGNTWLRYLIAGILYGIDIELASDQLLHELVPLVYKPYYKRFNSPMTFSSHGMPTPHYRRVIYILRDGRDVMVSHYHHARASLGRDITFLEAMELETIKRLHPVSCKWHEHVTAWLENPYKAQMMTIKYEDLKKDCVLQLQKICTFLGIQREKSFLQWVAKKGSFKSMRTREEKYGWDEWFWPKTRPFFTRRGEVGSYKDEMPLEALKIFTDEAAVALKRCGYLER